MNSWGSSTNSAPSEGIDRMPEDAPQHAAILIVDDEEANVRFLGRLLNEAGYTISTARRTRGGPCVYTRRSSRTSFSSISTCRTGPASSCSTISS